MMKKRIGPQFVAFTTALLASATLLYAQGPLAPPGAPAPAMKTLEQVEPRTPISTVPFVVSTPGSYYATANLTGSSGITISTNNVTVDLHGFALTGTSGNAGVGIRMVAGTHNVEIRNGTIAQWGQFGVNALSAESIMLFNLRVFSNGLFATSHSGIAAGKKSVIKNCVAELNSAGGIVTLQQCKVSECTARSNGSAGITVSDDSTVAECSASSNGAEGIRAGSWCVVMDSTARSNVASGIAAVTGSTISRCNSSFNELAGVLTGSDSTIDGCTVSSNGFDGIRSGSGCVVRGCAAAGNTENGMTIFAGSVITECTARSNGDDGISAGAATVSDCTVSFNVGDGIQIGSDSRVVDNTCFRNGEGGDGAGIRFTLGGSRIENNHVTDNDWGIKATTSSTSGTLIVRNTASGNTGAASSGGADPHFDFNPTNNPHGVIEDISALAGGAITSTHINRNWFY